MKKVICFILMILTAVSLTACGEKESEATADESVIVTEKEDNTPPDFSISRKEGNIDWVYKNGAMYYSNDEGLWCLTEDGEEQQIVKGDVTAFSTDGQKILYGETPSDASDDGSAAGRISVINTDGTQKEVLLESEEENLLPITIDHDVLYYVTDTQKKAKGELKAWDIAASEEDKKMSGVSDVLLASGNQFYYVTDFAYSGCSLFCYHTDFDEDYHVGNDEFKWAVDQEVFWEDDTYYAVSTAQNGGKTDITVYQLMPDDTTEVVKEVKGVEGSVKKDNCLICQSALYYLASSSDTDTVYRLALDGDESEALTDTGRSGELRLAGDSVVFETDDVIFYCDGSELKAIDGLNADLIHQKVLWCDDDTIYYTDNTKISVLKKQLKDETPSVESKSDPVSDSPEKTRPASQDNQYVTTNQAKTGTFGGTFYLTGEYAETAYEVTNRLPEVVLDSSDATTVNEEIQTTFGKHFETAGSDQYKNLVRVDYVCYLNDNILSLAIESVYEKEHTFKVYNFDVTSGKRLTDDEFFALSDISLEGARQLIVEGAPGQYNSIYQMKMIQSDLDRTEENLSNAQYYFDSDKQVIVIYTLWGTPGAGAATVLLPLDAYYKG